MPIMDRRYYIKKHNEEQEGIRDKEKKKDGTWSIEGAALNRFAKEEQDKATRGGL